MVNQNQPIKSATESNQSSPQIPSDVQSAAIAHKKTPRLYVLLIIGALFILIGVAAVFYLLGIKNSQELGYSNNVATSVAPILEDNDSTSSINKVTATPIALVTDNPSTAEITANWLTYSNTSYGFTFKYPQGFSPEDDGGYTVRVIPNHSFSEYLSNYQSQSGEDVPTVNVQVSDLQAMGTVGKTIKVSGTDVYTTAVFEAPNYLVEFSLLRMSIPPERELEIEETFKQILSTFQFTM